MSGESNWQQHPWNQSQQPQQPQPQAAPQAAQPNAPYYAETYYASAPQYGYGQMPQPAKKGKGWIVGLSAVVALFVLCIVGIVSCSGAFSSSLYSSSGSGSASGAGFIMQDSVAVIPLDGTIQYDGSFCSPEGLKEQLDAAEENAFVKAVVLRVNSGGGTATAGEEMTEYVKQFSKPIVVSSASMNASAAYEISSQADYIYTAQTTFIGSIGTALSITDLSGLYEKLGINIDDITSSESKNSSYGNRPLTEEERAYYQDMVNQVNETFILSVSQGRNMSVDEVRVLATGMTFTGITAVENGLADEIGTLEDACKKAADLAGVSNYTTVTLSNASSVLNILDILGYSASGNDIVSALRELQGDDEFAK